MDKHTDYTNSPKKMSHNNNFINMGGIASLPASSTYIPKVIYCVHYVGLGGGGSNIIDFLYKNGIKGKFTSISVPSRKVHTAKEINFIPFTAPMKHDAYMIREGFRKSDLNQPLNIPESVTNIFNSTDFFVLISGLGGYTGTLMTESLTLQLHNANIPFLTLSSVPFDFEGNRTKTIALNTIDKLKHINNFQYYPLQEITKEFGNQSIKEAFSKADNVFLSKIKSEFVLFSSMGNQN